MMEEDVATTPKGLVRPHGYIPPLPAAPQKPRVAKSVGVGGGGAHPQNAAAQHPARRLMFTAEQLEALLQQRPASASSPRLSPGKSLPARLLR